MPRGRLRHEPGRGPGGGLMSLTLTLNGKPVTCQAGQTVLEVCRANGVELPTLCYLEGLSTVGACRGGSPGSSSITPAGSRTILATPWPSGEASIKVSPSG